MKIIKIAMIICLFGVALSSCEKDEDTDISAEQTTPSKVKVKNSKTVYGTSTVPCTVTTSDGVVSSGRACFKRSGRVRCETVNPSCNTSVANQIVATHLSALELEQWADGTFFDEIDVPFVEEHYAFFLELFQGEVILDHPDVIITSLQ
ncbi:MAG: hypothetical protein JKY48_19110 [Flavobacteriales bacterium]|nr:hypothetical protein [Flavobacteriales bacterium]